MFKKGESLIEIKPTPSPTEYAAAHEEYDTSVARETSATYDMQRYEKALKSGLITTSYTDYINAKNLSKHLS